jgi:chitodextrinase
MLMTAVTTTAIATIAVPAGYAATSATDTQPPTTPGSPTVTAITSSTITLSWGPSTDNTGVSGYEILRAQGRQSARLRTAVTGTSFTDTGLGSATTYSYLIRAVDAAGNRSTLTPAATAVTHRAGSIVPAGAPCLVEYYQTTTPGNITGAVVLTNTGAGTVSGWRVAWTFPGDIQVGASGWSATTVQNQQTVTATNMSTNAVIPPANDVEFGFSGSWTSNAATPTTFSMNGVACALG